MLVCMSIFGILYGEQVSAFQFFLLYDGAADRIDAVSKSSVLYREAKGVAMSCW